MCRANLNSRCKLKPNPLLPLLDVRPKFHADCKMKGCKISRLVVTEVHEAYCKQIRSLDSDQPGRPVAAGSNLDDYRRAHQFELVRHRIGGGWEQTGGLCL